jgi:glycosyltransferase involved in cell wall biosynthesis
LICFSHLRWDFVYQRPQHLLSRAARTHDVYFVEEPIFQAGIEPRLDIVTKPENVTVAVPALPEGHAEREIVRFQRRLIDDLMRQIDATRLIAWYYTPYALTFSRHLDPDLCIYDNMDELSAFLGASPQLLELERELFACAHVVFTGGQSLYEAKRGRHGYVHAMPSSIDAAHFRKARSRGKDMPEHAHLPHPRIGFFGVIDERTDARLLAEVAALKPNWQFVMLGPTVKIDPAALPRRDNIHWLGFKHYSELPGYLAGWDLGFMPFALNEATRFISPTKTPEFLAAGLPLVSTPITDVVRPYGEAGLVEIARTPEEAVLKMEMLLQRPRTQWLEKVDRHLSTMSWDKTWERMCSLMQAAPVPRRASSAPAVTRQREIAGV